jgi:hypothetical protein
MSEYYKNRAEELFNDLWDMGFIADIKSEFFALLKEYLEFTIKSECERAAKHATTRAQLRQRLTKRAADLG